jgi:hypothetical protein
MTVNNFVVKFTCKLMNFDDFTKALYKCNLTVNDFVMGVTYKSMGFDDFARALYKFGVAVNDYVKRVNNYGVNANDCAVKVWGSAEFFWCLRISLDCGLVGFPVDGTKFSSVRSFVLNCF